MDVVVVTPRSGDLVSLALVKKHLNVEHGDDDDLISLYVEAVASWLDGPAGWLGRSLAPQTLSVTWRGSDVPTGCKPLALPFGDATSVTSIVWRDDAGVEQALGEDDFELAANRVRLASGVEWASTDALTATYVAGYAGAALPKAIIAAVLLMTGDLYAFRETGVVGTISADVKMTTTSERLLSPFKLWIV